MTARQAKSPWEPGRRKRVTQFSKKREAVLDTAAAMFRERGYDGVSLSEVADKLNISKPTLYYYVQSKDDLLIQIKVRAQKEALDYMRAASASPGTAFEKLRSVMINYAILMSSDYGACLLLVNYKNLSKEVDTGTEEGNKIIHALLKEGLKDGSLQYADSTVAFYALFGSLNWISFWFRTGNRLSAREMAELQVDLLLNGVRGPAIAQGGDA